MLGGVNFDLPSVASIVNPGMVAAQLGGSMISGYANMREQAKWNERAEQNAWGFFNAEKDLANTAHQRAAADKRAAGIHPAFEPGQGAGGASGSAPPMSAPQINMPDVFAMGTSIAQLKLAEKRLAMEDRESLARISKMLTEKDVNKMKKILMQKGMVRAELEGTGAEILQKFLNRFQREINKPDMPGHHFNNNVPVGGPK